MRGSEDSDRYRCGRCDGQLRKMDSGTVCLRCENIRVEWVDGLGKVIGVEVDPHGGVVRANSREYEISALLSDGVDERMYRQLSTGSDEDDGLRTDGGTSDSGRYHRRRCPFCNEEMVGPRKFKRHVKRCEGKLLTSPMSSHRRKRRALHTASEQEGDQ